MDTIAKKVIGVTQLIISFGVILMIASNKTLSLILNHYEIALLVLLIFWMSIGLFIALISKEKSRVGLPSYENAPPPPDRNQWSKRTKPQKLSEKSNVLPLFSDINIAERFAIGELKQENLKRTKYIYMCSGGKVIVLNHQMGDVEPILIVKSK